MSGYTVVIKKSPTDKFQAYQGWNTTFASRKEAKATLDEAKRKFLAAKLVKGGARHDI